MRHSFTVRFLGAWVLLLTTGGIASAQTTASAPIVSQPSGIALSPALSSLPDARWAQGPQDLQIHPQPMKLPPRPAGTGGPNPAATQTKAGAHLPFTPQTNFSGIGANGYIPPDPNIAVGLTQIVQTVNSQFAVFDKATGNLVSGPKTLGTIWAGLGGPCATNNAGDPVVQYDKLADRWIITQLGNVRRPYSECIAVSTSGDPLDTYFLYAYSFGNNLNDYPKFGVWPTGANPAYLATYNIFANGRIFSGSQLCAYDRTKMLAGQPAPSICYLISKDGGYLPSDMDGSTAPSDGSPGYFLNFNTLSSLRLYKLSPNFAVPSSSTLTWAGDIPVASFSEACNGGACIPQPSTTQRLDSLGDRLMYRLAYRNFGDHEAMVVNHSVGAGSSVGVRWYELQSTTTPGQFSRYQQGTFAPDSIYRWMGSIAMDKAGNIGLGYSTSASSLFPAITATGRTPTMTPGTMGAEIPLQAGFGSQTGYTRWGDYTSMRIDPSDDCTFWYTNEFYTQSASYLWSTYIGSFKIPSGVCS